MKTNLLYILSASLLLSIAFSSCTLSNDVVTNKKIQKRKYQNGFFLAKKSSSNKMKSAVAEYVSPKMENSTSKEEINAPASIVLPFAKKNNSIVADEKKSEKKNLKNIIKTIREVNKAVKLASVSTKDSKTEKTSPFSKEKFKSEYEATLTADDDFKAPTETDLLKLGLTLLILGLVLSILAIIASGTIGGLAGVFYLLSSLAWLGGVVCLVLYFLDKYDI